MAARWARRTCERCGRTDLILADGGCPHCDEETLSRPAEATTRVRLHSGMQLPRVCLLCGASTNRTVRLRLVGPRPMKAPRQGGAADAFLALIPGGCLFTLLRGLGDAVDSRRPTFAVRVSQCAVCGREGPPVGRGPDYRARQLTFETHPRFADALAAQQREVERRHRGHQEGRSHS